MTPLGIGIIAFLSAGIGFLLGGLVMALRSRKEQPVSSKTDLPATEQKDPNLEEITRLWFDRRNRCLIVEVEGQRYRAVTQLNESGRRRVQAGLKGLRSWLEAAIPLSENLSVAQSPRSTSPIPASAEPLKASLSGQTAEAVRPISSPPEPAVKPVKTDLMGAASRILTPRGPVLQPQSIAAQINEILREKLHGTPLMERGIALMETPDQGVVVMVGMEKYGGVDAVPDPEIRRVLKDAVAEWERRSAK